MDEAQGHMAQADEAAANAKRVSGDAVRAAIARAQNDAHEAGVKHVPHETPEQALMRRIQEAPRTTVDVTRMEVATGHIWLADGYRLQFSIGVPPSLTRADGVVDQRGMPIYDIPWQLQVVVKPPKTK